MSTYPADWTIRALAALHVRPTVANVAIMNAWQQSTPLPPEANNPIGMMPHYPMSFRWKGTSYAGFDDISYFYNALTRFGASFPGNRVTNALSDGARAQDAWSAIRELGWPAVFTETDYPASVLDMCSSGFRESVQASDVANRKTSGIVGGGTHAAPSTGMQMGNLARVLGTAHGVSRALRGR